MNFASEVLTWADKQNNAIIYAIATVMICILLPFLILGTLFGRVITWIWERLP
jgi:hypothetical protein